MAKWPWWGIVALALRPLWNCEKRTPGGIGILLGFALNVVGPFEKTGFFGGFENCLALGLVGMGNGIVGRNCLEKCCGKRMALELDWPCGPQNLCGKNGMETACCFGAQNLPKPPQP